MQTTLTRNKPAPFWDRIAPKYAKKPISDPASYQEKIATVRRLLKADDRLLEIGCGTGGTAVKLSSSVAEVVATDISHQMIEIARTKLAQRHLGKVTFYQADASDHIDNLPFDAVCAFSLLHLVPDLDPVLARIHRQLKPGGLFISKTVCLGDSFIGIRLLVRFLTILGIAPPVAALSRSGLIRKLKSAGFEVETVTHFGNQRTNPFIVARKSQG